MKVLGRNFEKDGSGTIHVIPEEQEDMWHAYNLIQEGDYLRASTIRKVTSETATGTTSSQRVHTTLTVCVENVEFDTQGGTLHIKGRNVEENQHVKVLQAVIRHANFDVIKCILVASPGFVKDQFHEYMFEKAAKDGNKVLLDNKSKVLLVHASSGFKHSLKEVLRDPTVAAKLSDTKAAAEVKALETFYEMLQTEPSKGLSNKSCEY